MADYGVRKTDAQLRELEKRIKEVYAKAEQEVLEKLKSFEERHATRDEKYRQMVKDGKMSKDDYTAWLRGQVFQRKQWKAKLTSIQDTLYHADKVAQQMINDGRANPFIDNAVFFGKKIGDETGLKASFGSYDHKTVRRLIKDNPDILPPKKGVNKDKAYEWYNKIINQSVTQGIIQGESVAQIAKRISEATGQKLSAAMMRQARTAYTGSQNAGRMEMLREAKKMGINVRKQWLTVGDNRVRHAHVDLDGAEEEVEEPFVNDIGEIMYPGDPDADPDNVWNCRCTLTYFYPDYEE